MALYASHQGCSAPRRFSRDRFPCSTQGHLNNGVNRPAQDYSKETNKKIWHAKKPSVEEPNHDISAIPNSGAATILSGIVAPSTYVIALPQGPMANDHEASTSKNKPRGSKYTQPPWCPHGLTKTQKRRLQRLRNHLKGEQEADKQRDELVKKICPMAPTAKVWRPKQKGGACAFTTVVSTPPGKEDAIAIVSSTSLITSPSLGDISEPVDMNGEKKHGGE